MRQEFVNPFLTAAQHVFRMELGWELEFSGAELANDEVTSEDITAFIGVTGELEGNVFYGFRRPVMRSIVTTMLGRPQAGMDQLALSALGELANMITGNASGGLAAAGYTTDLTPPRLVWPKGSRFTTLGIPQILIRFETECGPFPIRVSLRENSQKMAA